MYVSVLLSLSELQAGFYMCTSLAPRPMTVVFGLGTRLCVHMRTTFENDVLRNGQQLGRGGTCGSMILYCWSYDNTIPIRMALIRLAATGNQT